jgi:hypothetical protein
MEMHKLLIALSLLSIFFYRFQHFSLRVRIYLLDCVRSPLKKILKVERCRATGLDRPGALKDQRKSCSPSQLPLPGTQPAPLTWRRRQRCAAHAGTTPSVKGAPALSKVRMRPIRALRPRKLVVPSPKGDLGFRWFPFPPLPCRVLDSSVPSGTGLRKGSDRFRLSSR